MPCAIFSVVHASSLSRKRNLVPYTHDVSMWYYMLHTPQTRAPPASGHRQTGSGTTSSRRAYLHQTARPRTSQAAAFDSIFSQLPGRVTRISSSTREKGCAGVRSRVTSSKSLRGRGSVDLASASSRFGGTVMRSAPARALISSSSKLGPAPREGRHEAGMQIVSCP